LWPKTVEDLPSSDAAWIIILASPESINELATHGRDVVGMDAVWKLLRFKNFISHFVLIFVLRTRYPITVILYCDEKFHGGLGAVCISRYGNAETLQFFIKTMKEAIWVQEKVKWDPTINIDKCKAERLAIKKSGLNFFLCQFHANRTIKKYIAQRKLSEEDSKSLMEKLCRVQRFASLSLNLLTYCRSRTNEQFLDRKQDFDRFCIVK